MDSTIISTLALAPDREKETLSLIEKCFEYSPENSFAIDFYPLMKKSNHQNCFILIEENKVCAHIACQERSFEINGEQFKVLFLGGICVDPSTQGKGLFRKIYEFVEDQFKDMALMFLWSDKLDLYEKFGYYPVFSQYQYKQTGNNNSSYSQISFKDLSTSELNQIKSLYNNNNEIRTARTDEDWDNIAQITSAKLFIKKNAEGIENYFIKDKGQDLQEIIHEYGKDSSEDIKEISNYGTVWSAKAVEELNPQELFGSLIKIGNPKVFADLVAKYTNSFLEVEKVDQSLVHFKFDDQTMSTSIDEFLQGVFGPGQYQELSGTIPLFICGLDSI